MTVTRNLSLETKVSGELVRGCVHECYRALLPRPELITRLNITNSNECLFFFTARDVRRITKANDIRTRTKEGRAPKQRKTTERQANKVCCSTLCCQRFNIVLSEVQHCVIRDKAKIR